MMPNRIFYLENTNLNPKSKSGYYNKFYRMIELDNGKFLAEWGYIGKSPLGTKEYSMNHWHMTQIKKENKGYVFANDPGNTNHIPSRPPATPAPFNDPDKVSKYDPNKVSDVRNRIKKVVVLLAQKENGELYERAQEIYTDFNNDPGTFTPSKIEEINEIYNKFRVDKN